MTGEDLRRLRVAQELSQTDMAELLGVKQPRISEWEKGVSPIPVYIVKLIDCLFFSGKK